MESTLKHGWWRLSSTDVLLVLNKVLVICLAWLFFFYLLLFGWDLHVQQELTRQKSQIENYEPDHITL